MPMSRDLRRSARVEFGFVVDFDEHVHAEAERRRLDFRRRAVVERRHDDEDAVGAQRARFRDLVGLVHEILAQHRQCGRGARRDQVVRAALERRRVGQHREAGRAAGLVGARQRRRVEIGADQPLGRARLLDLGDQGIVAAREPALDRPQETARRRGRPGRGLDRGGRPRALRRRDLLALVGFDAGEDVGHRSNLIRRGGACRGVISLPATL